MVQQLVSIVLLFVLSISSLTQAGVASSVNQRVTIQFSHSHSHSSSHRHDSEDESHHHDSSDVQSEAVVGSSVAGEPSSHDQAGDRHTHTVVITTSAGIALPQKLTIAFALDLMAVPPVTKEVDPPGDLSLGSIFRPPISA